MARFAADPPLPSALRREVESVARVRATLLLTGEVGTGKSTLARIIHRAGPRSGQPFVTVDCAALVSTLIQAELYGHEKGAFTDAREARSGLIRSAGSGSVFFDEIGVLERGDQARLLTLLERKTIRPLGRGREVPVEARILCATNENLPDLVRSGRFRRDLYDRVSVLQIHVPPLRQRRAELPAIMKYLLRQVIDTELDESTEPLPVVSREVLEVFRAHSWPGNLRELRNVLVQAVFQAVIVGGRRRIEPADIPEALLNPGPETPGRDRSITEAQPSSRVRYRAPEDPRAERENILNALRATRIKAEAADLLGMSRSTLYERIRLHRIAPSEWKRNRA